MLKNPGAGGGITDTEISTPLAAPSGRGEKWRFYGATRQIPIRQALGTQPLEGFGETGRGGGQRARVPRATNGGFQGTSTRQEVMEGPS